MQCMLIFKIVLVLELLWCWCYFVLILSLVCTRDVGNAVKWHTTPQSQKSSAHRTTNIPVSHFCEAKVLDKPGRVKASSQYYDLYGQLHTFGAQCRIRYTPRKDIYPIFKPRLLECRQRQLIFYTFIIQPFKGFSKM